MSLWVIMFGNWFLDSLILWPIDHSTLVSLHISKFKEVIVSATIYVFVSITKYYLQNPT